MDDSPGTARTRRGDEATHTPPAVVVDYDPHWREDFDMLRSCLHPLVADVALSIEHVGSTAVPGLAAKPIIDVDVVVADEHASRAAVHALASGGWTPEGDLGIPGRQALQARPDLPYHHLYVVIDGSQPHLDHVLLREHLRCHPAAAAEYGALKKRIAPLLRTDRQAYLEAKSELVQRLLAAERARQQPHHL
ncbi:GrpB family protein [Kineococcus radiotolerans]|nr:GrpB family protein [Kineococcus radiotolerans]